MKYNSLDYSLCKAESNAMTVYIIEEHGGDCREIIVDWDLSDEEEADLVARFKREELDFYANDGKWLPENEAYKGLHSREVLA